MHGSWRTWDYVGLDEVGDEVLASELGRASLVSLEDCAGQSVVVQALVSPARAPSVLAQWVQQLAPSVLGQGEVKKETKVGLWLV